MFLFLYIIYVSLIIYFKNFYKKTSKFDTIVRWIKRTRWGYLIVFIPLLIYSLICWGVAIYAFEEENLKQAIFISNVAVIFFLGIRYFYARQDYHISKSMPYLKETDESTEDLLAQLRTTRTHVFSYLIISWIVYIILLGIIRVLFKEP